MTSDYNVIMGEAAAGGGLEGLRMRQQNNQFYADLALKRRQEQQQQQIFQQEQQKNQILLAKAAQEQRDQAAATAAQQAMGAYYAVQPGPAAPQPLPAGSNMGMQAGFQGPMADRVPQMPRPPVQSQQTGGGDPMQDPDIQGPLGYLKKVAAQNNWTPDHLNEAAASIIQDRMPLVMQKRQFAARTQQQGEAEQIRQENMKLREQANTRQEDTAEGIWKGAPSGIEENPLGLSIDDWKKTLPDGARKYVESMVEGRSWPSPYQLARSIGAQKSVAAAEIMDPNASQSRFAEAEKYRTGEPALKIRSFNALANHMMLMPDIMAAMKNGDIRLINDAKLRYEAATGESAPVNMDAAAELISNEIGKAVLPSGGTGGERLELKQNLMKQNSPEQIKGVLDTYKGFVWGQLDALRQGYKFGTKGLDNFSDMLTGPAKDAFAKKEKSSGGSDDSSPPTDQSDGVPQDIQDIMSKYAR